MIWQIDAQTIHFIPTICWFRLQPSLIFYWLQDANVAVTLNELKLQPLIVQSLLKTLPSETEVNAIVHVFASKIWKQCNASQKWRPLKKQKYTSCFWFWGFAFVQIYVSRTSLNLNSDINDTWLTVYHHFISSRKIWCNFRLQNIYSVYRVLWPMRVTVQFTKNSLLVC